MLCKEVQTVNELVVIVEGETEQTFVRDQLSAYLAVLNTTAWAVLPGRNRNHGGINKWEVAKQDIIRTLREGRYYSTMFDYYAMPSNWPGRSESKSKPWQERAKTVEEMILQDVKGSLSSSFNPKQFIPYVQLHEFEALAFADIEQLVSVLAPITKHTTRALMEHFKKVLTGSGHPEAINDGYETCPSRRIKSQVPVYKKRAQGPIITKRIGIPMLRQECTHFGNWLSRLEAIDSGVI